MTRLTPVSWNILVARLSSVGFDGPYRSGKHYFMTRGAFRLTVPNPHGHDIGVPLLREILNRVGMTPQEWLEADKR